MDMSRLHELLLKIKEKRDAIEATSPGAMFDHYKAFSKVAKDVNRHMAEGQALLIRGRDRDTHKLVAHLEGLHKSLEQVATELRAIADEASLEADLYAEMGRLWGGVATLVGGGAQHGTSPN